MQGRRKANVEEKVSETVEVEVSEPSLKLQVNEPDNSMIGNLFIRLGLVRRKAVIESNRVREAYAVP